MKALRTILLGGAWLRITDAIDALRGNKVFWEIIDQLDHERRAAEARIAELEAQIARMGGRP